MAKRGRPRKGEQLDLIDVQPENIEDISELLGEYKDVLDNRIKLTKREVDLKREILEKVHEAHLQRLEDGTIRFRADGFLIAVTPTDEVIHIKRDKPNAEEEEPQPAEEKPTQKPAGKGRNKKKRTVGDVTGNGDKSMERTVAETEE